MNGILDLLKILYSSNKKLFITVVLVIALFAITACATGNAGGPPSGPVGRGC